MPIPIPIPHSRPHRAILRQVVLVLEADAVVRFLAGGRPENLGNYAICRRRARGLGVETMGPYPVQIGMIVVMSLIEVGF